MRKASLIYIYDKFMFLLNKTEQYKILISYLNWLTFDIFTLPDYLITNTLPAVGNKTPNPLQKNPFVTV